MKLSAKSGVALAITALSLVVTVGAGASDSVEPVDAWVMHCCTAYSEAAPATSVTAGASGSDSVEPVDARVISCCTAYSEAAPSTPVTGGGDTSDSVEPVDAWVMHCCTAYSEEVPSTSVTPLPTFLVTPLSTSAAYVGMMNQLRNLTEPNAIAWGWSKGLANDQASAGVTQYGGSAARVLTR